MKSDGYVRSTVLETRSVSHQGDYSRITKYNIGAFCAHCPHAFAVGSLVYSRLSLHTYCQLGLDLVARCV